MKKRNMLITLGLALGLGIGVAAGVGARREAVKATTNRTFYLDCTGHDWDTYDSICLHTWNGADNRYYQATQAGDNYWSVTVDIDGLSGVEFYKCNSVAANHESADNLYNKQSWLTLPSDNYYYTVTSDGNPGDDTNWSAPASWSLTGSSSAALSTSKFDADGLQFYGLSVNLATNDVIQFTNGTLTKGFADLRDAGNGQTAKEKGLVANDGTGKVKVVKGGAYDIYVNAITGKVWMQQDAATEADHWAEEFLATGCTTASTGTKAKWSDHATSYAALTEGAKELFEDEAHVAHDAIVSGNLKLAVQRYDYVLTRYGINGANTDEAGYDDFIGRAAKLTPTNEMLSQVSNNNNNATLIIVVISSLVLISVGGFFLLRKKREN